MKFPTSFNVSRHEIESPADSLKKLQAVSARGIRSTMQLMRSPGDYQGRVAVAIDCVLAGAYQPSLTVEVKKLCNVKC